jgi:LysM repeat protein
VRAGDTLSSIAAATGSTANQLASVNCLEDSRLIVSDQLLFVPRVPDTAIPTAAPQVTSPPPPPPEPVDPVPASPQDDDDDDDDDDNDDDDNDDDD